MEDLRCASLTCSLYLAKILPIFAMPFPLFLLCLFVICTFVSVFVAYCQKRRKLLCYHRRNLFVYVSRIARPSGRNWVGLYEEGRSIRRLFPFWVHVILIPQLPSRVGCSFQGKLFSIFKLLCLVFVRFYLSCHTTLENCVLLLLHLHPRDKISSPIKDLFCSRKPLTYPGSASV